MYRTILSTALVAMLFLTGCGGSGSKGANNSDNKGGGESAGASAPSTLPADQQAEVGVEINLGELMADEATAAMLESNPEVPPFVKSMKGFSVYASLPADMGMAMDPSNFDFYAKLSFNTAEDCQSAYDMIFGGAPTEDVEKKGKTFKKIAAPNAPVVFILHDGDSIQAYSQNYVDSDATSFASEGLRAALAGEPKSEPFKMAVDVKSASGFLSGLTAFAPQAEAFVKANSIVMAGGGKGDLLFMMAVDAPDEDTAKKIKSTVQLGMGMLAGLATSGQLPSEEVAPATNEFINYLMSNLKPQMDGNTVKVVINKPENYEELKKKMTEESKKIQEEMQQKQQGGFDAPGLNPPDIEEDK